MMSPLSVLKQHKRLKWLLLGWLVVSFFITANLPLHYDEAYYWALSNHIDFGYYDHPPLTVYFIRLTRVIFGETEYAVRLPSVLFQLISIYLVFIYLVDLTRDSKISFWWSVVYALMPLAVLWGGLGMNSDAGVITFGLLSTIFFKKAFTREKIRYWVAFGASFGLGLITKFTFPVLLPGLFLYMLLDRRRRRYFARKEIYLSILVAILIFLPFLIWNVQHDFVTFRFNFLIRQDPWHFSFWRLQNTLAIFLLMFGPIPLVLSIAYVIRSLGKLKTAVSQLDPAFYIELTLIPLFLVIGFFSLIRWQFMMILCFAIVVNAALFFHRHYENGIYRSHSSGKVVGGLIAASVAIFIVMYIILAAGLVKLSRDPSLVFGNEPPRINVDPTQNRNATTLFGAAQVGKRLDELVKELRDQGVDALFIASGDYREASQLSFYAASHPEIFLIGNRDMYGRNYVFFRQKAEPDLIGKHALYVTQFPSTVSEITGYFREINQLELFYVTDKSGRKLRLFYFYLCLDYQGDDTGILDIDTSLRR